MGVNFFAVLLLLSVFAATISLFGILATSKAKPWFWFFSALSAVLFVVSSADGPISASSPKASAAKKPDSVSSAYALCRVIDGTGLASTPCEVSGRNSSVTATVDMIPSEARDLCPRLAAAANGEGLSFEDGWKLLIRSPYSGENSIAFCDL